MGSRKSASDLPSRPGAIHADSSLQDGIHWRLSQPDPSNGPGREPMTPRLQNFVDDAEASLANYLESHDVLPTKPELVSELHSEGSTQRPVTSLLSQERTAPLDGPDSIDLTARGDTASPTERPVARASPLSAEERRAVREGVEDFTSKTPSFAELVALFQDITDIFLREQRAKRGAITQDEADLCAQRICDRISVVLNRRKFQYPPKWNMAATRCTQMYARCFASDSSHNFVQQSHEYNSTQLAVKLKELIDVAIAAMQAAAAVPTIITALTSLRTRVNIVTKQAEVCEVIWAEGENGVGLYQMTIHAKSRRIDIPLMKLDKGGISVHDTLVWLPRETESL